MLSYQWPLEGEDPDNKKVDKAAAAGKGKGADPGGIPRWEGWLILPGSPARWDSICVQGGQRKKINKSKHFWSLGSAQYSYHMYKINQNSIH